jgi:hypothetical protein
MTTVATLSTTIMIETAKRNLSRIDREHVPNAEGPHKVCLTREYQWQVVTAKEYFLKIREYWKQISNYIMTTRFNQSTYRENRAFCEKQRGGAVKCVYCCPLPVLSKIPQERYMFVLEMNNEVNRIMGIGLVRNRYGIRRFAVYSNMSYNRYVYVGKHRIDRTEMTAEEEGVMQWLDSVCFKGANHMKRGQGMTAFPVEIMFQLSSIMDLPLFMKEMFQSRMRGDK